MEFSFGQGRYIEGKKEIAGQIILSEHKIFIKGPEGDLAQTYIPLEKIEKISLTPQGVKIQVRPAITIRYSAIFQGERHHMKELVKDIVQRRGLKKRLLINEWIEEQH